MGIFTIKNWLKIAYFLTSHFFLDLYFLLPLEKELSNFFLEIGTCFFSIW